MNIFLHPRLESAPQGSMVVIPVWEGGELAVEAHPFKGALQGALESGDFKATCGETFLCHVEGKRIVLLGLGKRGDVSVESVRRSFAAPVSLAITKKSKTALFFLPALPETFFRAICEGVCLANYSFAKWKSKSAKESGPSLLEEVGFIGVGPEHLEQVREVEAIVRSVHWVRDLVNGNADDKLSALLGELESAFQASGVSIQIFDKKKLVEMGMGLILAVSRGSVVDPCLIQASYEGNPGSQEKVVLIGKGITYDTGGLSIKPTDNMLTMKCDMAGAAAVLGAVRAAAALKLKVNVVALAPMAENSIDAKSYKLGDVYRSYSGRTVEITNTDAEGRLILADALGYAAKTLQPSCMIDVATLTGAAVVALGDDVAALFSDDQKICDQLLASSITTGEMLWRLPLVADYKDAYKSEIADTVNSGGREGSAIKAALFLQPFAASVPWAHIDLAGPAYLNKAKHYNTSRATGYGVRLLLDFLKTRVSS